MSRAMDMVVKELERRGHSVVVNAEGFTYVNGQRISESKYGTITIGDRIIGEGRGACSVKRWSEIHHHHAE